MTSQQQASRTPMSKRDSWQTPQWLFEWADRRFDFTIDLAASKDNAKVYSFITANNDSLTVSWSGLTNQLGGFVRELGWCNPPYSETGKWLEKAWLEAQEGFSSVFLIPTPNGDLYWRDHVFGKASEIIFINGRVSFELPDENGKPKPQSGNTRGSCLVVYNRRYEGHTQLSWVNRDDMKAEFEQSLQCFEGGNPETCSCPDHGTALIDYKGE